MDCPEGTCVIISPHLDDAVFGCGDFIGACDRAIVATLFAGLPRDARGTSWDLRSGFVDARIAMLSRRAEDRAALDVLGARPVWLPFLDGQYDRGTPARRLVAAMRRVILAVRARTVVLPLGLFHSDHLAASDALLELRAGHLDLGWRCYADAMYRFMPEQCERRHRELRARGLRLDPLPDGTGASVRKRAAVACYASQLRALAVSGHVACDDVFAPERMWDIAAS